MLGFALGRPVTQRAGIVALAVMFALALLAEAMLRAVGYADPALYVADSQYEYVLAPNQSVRRLATRIETNRYGMRASDFDAARRAPSERRVLVLGDSVVSGVNWTDQSALATTLLAADAWRVMPVAAGGWGPGNMRAYVQRRGLYGADMVIVVLSSHDIDDDRGFGPLDAYATPVRKPRVALVRFVDQYVLGGPAREARRVARAGRAGDARESLSGLLADLRTAGASACIVQHWTQTELAQGAARGHAEIAAIARTHGARVVDGAARQRAEGAASYRDDIHLNNSGQRVLADLLRECLN